MNTTWVEYPGGALVNLDRAMAIEARLRREDHCSVYFLMPGGDAVLWRTFTGPTSVRRPPRRRRSPPPHRGGLMASHCRSTPHQPPTEPAPTSTTPTHHWTCPQGREWRRRR